MRLCTSEQMRSLDRLTIEKYNTPGEVLMERAGRWLAIISAETLEQIKGSSITIICGRGNNGGDGWVAGRLLKNAGFYVKVISIGDPRTLSGDALLNFKRAEADNVRWRTFDGTVPECDIIIDAILGTGIKGAPEDEIARAISSVNLSAKTFGSVVISADIPSGVNCDDGSTPGESVLANITVTFGFPKVGHLIHPGCSRTGQLYIADIGIDERAEKEVPISYEVSTLQEMSSLLPYRPPNGHKGTFGKVLLVAGSCGMSGAVALAGISALRSGAGLCYACVPRSIVDNVDILAHEVVVVPMPEVRKKRCLSLRANGELVKRVAEFDSVAIGPGLGRHFETIELVRRFLQKLQKPVIIDADALFSLSGTLDTVIPAIIAPSVMTPHLGELARLLDKSIDEISSRRIFEAKNWAKELFTTLVIKGNPTIIASEDSPIVLNPTGNDGMATAGSGDVLTGLIAGFLAQGLSPFNSARLGVWVHGSAGDFAKESLGNRAMIASDIVNHIKDAFAELTDKEFTSTQQSKHLKTKYIITQLGAGMVYLEIKD